MFGDDAGTADRVRIKICGITNLADASAAAEFGADALGFNFYPGSKRYIKPQQAAEWAPGLPRSVRKVAILVNPTVAEATAIAALPWIDALQLHGTESPDFCASLAQQGIPFAKAVPVASAESLATLPSFFTKTIVLDSATPESFGGSGVPFSWHFGQRFVADHPDLRVVLAGGLTPDNVLSAILKVRPFGVDVSSGVESSPGKKDPDRLRRFIATARTA
jgi:phosphoribosylanthranilate isomerase